MARQIPYLQRRGDTFAFRIAVPQALRPVIRYREICKCLHTSDKRIALPRALALAAKTKLLFHEVRVRMETGDKEGLLELVRQAKHKLELDALREQHEEEMIEERLWHLREQKRAAVRIVDVVTQLIASGLLARGGAMDRESSARVAQKNGPTCVPETPTLSAVVQHFLDKYRADKKGEIRLQARLRNDANGAPATTQRTI
jgi:hypothetical protein